MLGRLYAIGLNTFREAIRKRFLYAVLLLVVGANLFTIVLGEMSLNHESRVARDVGLAAIRLLGCCTAIILGAVLLYNEIQRRTIHSIISKPIERYEFVLGKYLGMVMTLTLLIGLFTLAMMWVLSLQGMSFSSELIKAVILAYMEVLLIAGVAVFFSSFASPVLSGVFSFFLWRLGHVTPEMRQAAESADEAWIRTVCEAALRIIPDLHLFAISGNTFEGEHVTIHASFVSWGYVSTSLSYGLLYLTALLVLAIVIFARRDFV